jgi:protein TonB
MTNDLKPFLIISLLLHLVFFIATAFHSKKILYVNLPVDLMFSNPPAAAPPEAQPPAPLLKEKEPVLPKKQKKAAVKPAKKPEPKNAETPKPLQQQPAQAQPQVVANANAAPSSPISLDAAKFPYAYYTNMIVKRINRNWQWAQSFGKMKAVIYFKIQKDGRITDIAVKESSGEALFDQQAVRAVSLADPLAPLPDGYSDTDLGVYFEFQFRE